MGRLIPAGTGLAMHRARKQKGVWEQEERAALLEAEKAAQLANLEAAFEQPAISDETPSAEI